MAMFGWNLVHTTTTTIIRASSLGIIPKHSKANKLKSGHIFSRHVVSSFFMISFSIWHIRIRVTPNIFPISFKIHLPCSAPITAQLSACGQFIQFRQLCFWQIRFLFLCSAKHVVFFTTVSSLKTISYVRKRGQNE